MIQTVLQKSKLLCYFELDSIIKNQIQELFVPLTLPLSVYHYHYPPVYYSIIYQHFKNLLPSTCTRNHICFIKKGVQLAPDLPLGLQIENNDIVNIGVRQLPVPDGFKLIKTNWKKAYTIVNKQSGCDHVFKKIDQNKQLQLYSLHLNGHCHNLHKVPKYEGNCIALKIYIQGFIIERKEENLQLKIEEYLKIHFGDLTDLKKGVFTHGVKINLSMSLKELLWDWNYNDGYCYLKIII